MGGWGVGGEWAGATKRAACLRGESALQRLTEPVTRGNVRSTCERVRVVEGGRGLWQVAPSRWRAIAGGGLAGGGL